ncbi:MAG: hypothetical protein JRI68_31330 [Deltaproteobacteria bacterium]|nr:hypothetical protein [Deltaproteobacteria bacterium]
MAKRQDIKAGRSQGKSRSAWLAFAGAMVLGLGIYGVRSCQRDAEQRTVQERQRVAAQAWANLQHCALGGPVSSIANLPRRQRLIELAGGRTGDPDGWPTGCATHATELYQVLADKGSVGAFKVQLAERLGCDQQCALDQPAAQLQGLDQLAKQAGLPVVVAKVAAPLLLERELLQKAQLTPLTPWNAKLIERDVLEDGAVRLLFTSKAQGPQLCELRADAAGASCDPVRLEGSPAGLRLLPGGEVAVVSRPGSGDGGRSFHRADTGAAVSVHRGLYQGLALTEIGNQEYEVAAVQDGKARGTTKLKLPDSSSTPWLMAGHLGWLEQAGEGASTLQLRQLDDDGAIAGRLSRAAAAVSPEPPKVCRAGSSAVALFGAPGNPRALVFYDGKAWSEVVPVGAALRPTTPAAAGSARSSAAPAPSASIKAPPRPPHDAAEFGIIGLIGSASPAADRSASPWGKVPDKKSALFDKPKDRGPSHQARQLRRRRARPGVPTHAFTCTADAATITWRMPRPGSDEIHQLRCTPQGCKRDVATIEGLSVKVWWLAAALGERTLVVWRARGGELRMRLAPLGELPAAKDVLIMDSADHGGPKSLELEAFVGTAAVVFLFRDVGYQGLRIDAEGRFSSLL